MNWKRKAVLYSTAAAAAVAGVGYIGHKVYQWWQSDPLTEEEEQLLAEGVNFTAPLPMQLETVTSTADDGTTQTKEVEVVKDDYGVKGPFWNNLVCEARTVFRTAEWTQYNEEAVSRWIERKCSEKGVRTFDVSTRLDRLVMAVFYKTHTQRLMDSLRRKGLKLGYFSAKPR